MNAKEEITKLIMASYDQGVKDAKQEALAALEQMVAAARADEQKKWQDQTAVEIHEAILDEREACVQDIQMHIPRSGRDTTEYQRAMRMIERIRARSNT